MPSRDSFQPGDVVSSSLCERCLCGVSSNPLSDVFTVNCETELCNTQCPKVSTGPISAFVSLCQWPELRQHTILPAGL